MLVVVQGQQGQQGYFVDMQRGAKRYLTCGSSTCTWEPTPSQVFRADPGREGSTNTGKYGFRVLQINAAGNTTDTGQCLDREHCHHSTSNLRMSDCGHCGAGKWTFQSNELREGDQNQNCVQDDGQSKHCSDSHDPIDWPVKPAPGRTPFINSAGQWYIAVSGNGDISKGLTIGMSWTTSKTVTNSDQLGLAYSLELSGEFLGLGAKETLTASYSHTWQTAVMNSNTTTVTNECQATCHKSDLPKGAPGWNLYQWKFSADHPSGDSSSIDTVTCDYLCMPQPQQPKCPRDCCADIYCQQCRDGCLAGLVSTLSTNHTDLNRVVDNNWNTVPHNGNYTSWEVAQ